MIKEKEFESLQALNEFVSSNNVTTISIETYEYDYNTGLPLWPRGADFITKHIGKRLFYKETKLFNNFKYNKE